MARLEAGALSGAASGSLPVTSSRRVLLGTRLATGIVDARSTIIHDRGDGRGRSGSLARAANDGGLRDRQGMQIFAICCAGPDPPVERRAQPTAFSEQSSGGLYRDG